MNIEEIENNKPEYLILNTTLVFHHDEPKKETFGSDSIAYELYYNTKDGILQIFEIGAFGDRTLIKRFCDRRNRGITLKEMLENIEEISQMTYEEFIELIEGGSYE